MRYNNKFIQKIVKTYQEQGNNATRTAKILRKNTTDILRVVKREKVFVAKSGKGSGHSQWKGGRGIKSGYWTIYMPEHPRALNIGRVFEHIVVAEKKYGRTIKKGEPIHHIDFDRLNNNPENIYLCKNHQEHMDLHYSLEEVARDLFRQGKLGFINGKYVWL